MIVARFIGVDEVIEQFEKIGKPYFSMWCKTAKICQYEDDDLEEAKELIREEIERNIKRKMSHECFLKIHPKSEANYTLKSEVYYNLVFRSYESTDFAAAVNPATANYMMMEKLNEISSRLAAVELEKEFDDEDDDDDDLEDDDLEDDDQVSGMIGKVEKLLDHPLANRLIDKIFGADKNNEPVRSLAGLSADEQTKVLNQALQSLFKKGLTLDHLVKLAAMPEAKIQMLLTMI